MGLIRTLLWGDEDEAEQSFENTSPTDSAAQDTTWSDSEDTVDLYDQDSAALQPTPDAYDPEQSFRRSLEREAAEARERDALDVQVGNLALALESVLRLLKDKGVITDLDLRRMEQQVDLEDGQADGEYHPGVPPVPSHCPQCQARIPAGKRLCQLCGHRFPTE